MNVMVQPVEEKYILTGKRQQAMEAALEELVNKLQLGEEQFETAAVDPSHRSKKQNRSGSHSERKTGRIQDLIWKNRFSYLHRDSTSFCKGLTVTTFYLAKGLEFDQVFSVFPQKDQSPIAKQATIYCSYQSTS